MSINGPAWDLSDEYARVDAPELAADLDAFDLALSEAQAPNEVLTAALDTVDRLEPDAAGPLIDAARSVHVTLAGARKLLGNVDTYVRCLLSVDGSRADALALQGRLEGYETRLASASQPLAQFLDRASDAVIDAYLDDERTRASTFAVRHRRQRRSETLSLAEENLISRLGIDGIHAWGRLYDQLSSSIRCEVSVGNETHSMGLAAAAGLMLKPDDGLRRNAWLAINNAWEQHEESCAAALNSIAGWRLSLYETRGGAAGPVHFLTPPAHDNRIRRATLDTLLAVARQAAPIARRAANVQARAYGKAQLGPWDNRAPAPVAADGDGTPFEAAIELIADAYGQVDSALGDFVRMMAANRWIEGSHGDRKRPGAYCTRFPRSGTPRVYMTYSGGASDVITLAHELGHAWHGWVMRDLDDDERSYGMSLAETASTFGETIVRNTLLEAADSPQQAFDIAWQDAQAAVAFILNIPARFQFEHELYERRNERPLRPDEMKDMMSRAWQDAYGDALSEPDPMFWASKLHFYISDLSFYNFPYLFGYLFSLGVYAQRERLGDDFFPAYTALLRDTGRMTAEDLAMRHLGADLTQPQFWQDSIALVERSITRFESLGAQLGH